MSTELSALKEFLKTSFQKVRSPRRTTKLHRALLDDILNIKPEWRIYEWKIEVRDENGKQIEPEYLLRPDGYCGSFKIDIVGLSDGKPKIILLIKSIQTSVTKNIKNYANTPVGEAARVMFAPGNEIEALYFITVLPRVAPRYKAGKVDGYDDVVKAKSRTQVDHVLQAQYNGTVKAIDIFYDIKNVRNLTDFRNIEIENLDSLVL